MTTVDEYWEETFDHQRPDLINDPPHYKHPSGVECIDIAETMSFCRGAAFKYIWRAGQKGDEIEDLRKAKWFIEREIQRLQAPAASAVAEASFECPCPECNRARQATRALLAKQGGKTQTARPEAWDLIEGDYWATFNSLGELVVCRAGHNNTPDFDDPMECRVDPSVWERIVDEGGIEAVRLLSDEETVVIWLLPAGMKERIRETRGLKSVTFLAPDGVDSCLLSTPRRSMYYLTPESSP